MPYKITPIAENTTYRHNALAQHGQSILIENGDYKMLFDVGEVYQGLAHNLAQLRISLHEINDIVISHRHIDHIGALPDMIDLFDNQRIYLPEQLGEPHLKNHPQKYNFLKPNPDGGYDLAINGIELDKVMNYQDIYLVSEEGIRIHENIYSTGCVGDWMREQAIVIDQKDLGITVILGCSHPTVEILVSKAIAITGNNKVRGIIGGFHYTDLSDDEIREKSKYFRELNIEFIVPSHCTTVVGAQVLKEELGDIVVLSKTKSFGVGNSVELGEVLKINFV